VQVLLRQIVVRAGVPAVPSERTLDAASLDEERAVARERLEAERFCVRALSFGPTGLPAYIEGRSP
jgi:hypothetical protein